MPFQDCGILSAVIDSLALCLGNAPDDRSHSLFCSLRRDIRCLCRVLVRHKGCSFALGCLLLRFFRWMIFRCRPAVNEATSLFRPSSYPPLFSRHTYGVQLFFLLSPLPLVCNACLTQKKTARRIFIGHPAPRAASHTRCKAHEGSRYPP